MKNKILLLLLSNIFLYSCLTDGKQKQKVAIAQNETQEVELLANGKLRYIELNGTPYERGLMHGKVLKKEIQEVIRLFKKEIAQTTKQEPDLFIAKFLEQTDYKTAVQKWMPEIRWFRNGSGNHLYASIRR